MEAEVRGKNGTNVVARYHEFYICSETLLAMCAENTEEEDKNLRQQDIAAQTLPSTRTKDHHPQHID
jgi:hypothetical protein